MILYCYISHNKKLLEDHSSVSETMEKLQYNDFVIFYSGDNIFNLNKTIHISCDDTYEGLPNKIHTMCRHISNNYEDFRQYSHFCKIDSSTIIKTLFPYYYDIDYYGYRLGQINPPDYRRSYHFGKCSENSIWNKQKYTGNFVPYCGGGVGYILSKQSVNCISEKPNDPEHDIYEDLYVGKKLLECGIHPKHLNMLSYIEKW